MKLHVWQHPDSNTIASCREVADDAPSPSAPWVEMTLLDYETWRVAQTPIANPSIPPTSVPRRAFLRVLRKHGIKDAMIRAAIASLPDELTRDLAEIDYDNSVTFQRQNPLILAMGPAFGFTQDSQMDALFEEAALEDQTT